MTGHRFPAEEKKRLNDENRRRVQPAEGIIERMALSPHEVVADLGSGTGYLAIPLAYRVRKVFALDVQEEMLADLRAHTPEEVKDRIVTVPGELPRLQFDNGSLDRAILMNVIHEVKDRAILVAELRRALRPGGRLTIVDFPKKETSFGPPLHERINAEEMLALFSSFREIERWDLPEFYQLELER